jgi:uncharacterized membrane protein
MPEHPLYLLGALALIVAASEWLCRTTPLRHLGTSLLVIIVTALVANLGFIPTYSDEIPVYSGVFKFVAPLAIFWLLLGVQLKEVFKAGRSMILLFVFGAIGTSLGVVIGMRVVNGEEAFGELYNALGGMFVGTYTGGSVNFNAIALEYGVVKEGALYAGAAAVDSLMTAVWMGINLVMPRLLGSRNKQESMQPTEPVSELAPGVAEDTESVHPLDIAWLVALGAGCITLSDWLSGWMKSEFEWGVPSTLILTSFALALAQLPIVAKLKGTRMLGMFSVYIFLAVIGALCDVEALRSIGSLGGTLFIFVSVVLAVHGLVVYGAGAAMRLDPAMSSVASQANVGGGTTALACARSLGRSDLVLPAILIGSLGTALGTYMGFSVAKYLL